MRYLVLLATLCFVLATGSPVQAKRMYEAWTTVIDMQSQLKGSDHDRHMADLATLAKSQTVVQRTLETLATMSVTDPFMVLSTLEIESVKDTNVLLIKVRSESQDIAKATADILAHEIIRFYDESIGNKSGKPALRVLETAKTGPVLQFRIFGVRPKLLAYICGFVLIGIIIGIPIGVLIARRSIRATAP